MADDEASDMVLIDAQLPVDETWMRLNTRRRQLRHDLLDAARRDLGLGRAKIIHPGRAVLALGPCAGSFHCGRSTLCSVGLGQPYASLHFRQSTARFMPIGLGRAVASQPRLLSLLSEAFVIPSNSPAVPGSRIPITSALVFVIEIAAHQDGCDGTYPSAHQP